MSTISFFSTTSLRRRRRGRRFRGKGRGAGVPRCRIPPTVGARHRHARRRGRSFHTGDHGESQLAPPFRCWLNRRSMEGDGVGEFNERACAFRVDRADTGCQCHDDCTRERWEAPQVWPVGRELPSPSCTMGPVWKPTSIRYALGFSRNRGQLEDEPYPLGGGTLRRAPPKWPPSC